MGQIIQCEFDGYMKSVYGVLAQPGSDQYEHLRAAFFGGALIALARDPDDIFSMQCELREFEHNAPIANRVLS